MTKIGKGYNLILVFATIGVFLFVTKAYSFQLRPPMQFNNSSETSKDDVKEQELWPEFAKAIEKFKRIKDSSTENELVRIKFPPTRVSLDKIRRKEPAWERPDEPFQVLLEAGPNYNSRFEQEECIVMYRPDGQDCIMDTQYPIVTNKFDYCFVGFFYAVDREDKDKRILIGIHSFLWPFGNRDVYVTETYYQLFLFVKGIIRAYGIDSDDIIAAFYGSAGLDKKKDAKTVRSFLRRLFPNSYLEDKHWLRYSIGGIVSARAEGDNLSLIYKPKGFSRWRKKVLGLYGGELLQEYLSRKADSVRTLKTLL